MDSQSQNNNLPNSNNLGIPIIKADLSIIFAGDSYGLFVFKKVEKISTAIYMLTALMSEKEPLRNRLREIANFMVISAFEMSERIWGEDAYQKNLLAEIFEAMTFSDIALHAKMMSPMNHKILVSELGKLSEFLVTSATNSVSAKIAFDPNLFDGNYNFVQEKSYKNQFENERKIPNEDFSSVLKGQKDMKGNTDSNVLNRMSEGKLDKKIKDKDNRQAIILEMLKSGVKLSIKDFAQNIKDVSEKTIQRELIIMLEKGLLKKEGERRWSKYFLA